ncbi:hybrid sensor histidine kinase/response regulator [Blastococcus sp. TBT05-19]|uniref:hybrid sensor histidine kinase/response regulator n=1 Tax=Blastococcus sp. TBT05-19 TaxID=2250581 RepID=UPI000DEA288B|nr:response regulator [Blastococcus sp. TBT05-19]RBY93868.1 hybrid sensor histidine kinase/response regulator [Blastococcus sp. TBT05-19]
MPRLSSRPAARDPRPLRVLLRRPLVVGMAALITVAVTTFGLAIAVVTVLGGRVDRANDMIGALQDGHIAMINQETSLRGFLVTREARFLEPYRKGAADLAEADAVLSRLIAGDPELEETFAALEAAENRFIDEWLQPVLAEQPALGDVAALSELLRRDKALFDRYRSLEGEMSSLLEERRERAYDQQYLVLLGGAFGGLVLTGVVAFAVRRANRRLAAEILPPTQQVRETLAALSAGDVGARATEAGPAELRDIAGDVNALGEALHERDEKVAARETELVAARDEAERAGQAKTAFLATMSHEIRTPLNAVLGLTDLLLTTELTDEQRSHLDTVSRSGDSLLSLINDILDFSKIEAGELDLERAPFQLDDVVYDVAQLLAPQAAGKGLDLLVDIDAEHRWALMGDGSRLRQVLTNLVGNALKFTAVGQVFVQVTGRLVDGRMHCTLAVSDTGIGISQEQRRRLFRSFSQGDASITRSYGGTGLGLAISQRIAAAMGGDIEVTSEAGLGSTFTVRVVLDQAPLDDDDRGLAGALAGRRLLVVDDNETNLRILEHQLSRAGATCVLAADGPAALVAAADGGFDACLTDLHMPGMDGEEVARRLRELPGTADVPLVLLSSSTSLADATAGTFAARLHKPVRPERLVQTLRSVLQPSAKASAPRAVPGAGPAGTGLRVLVAEDHEVNAHLIKLYLRQLGHECVHVPNGHAAVEAVRQDRYDVVLMDAQMPVMGGVEATTAIRALDIEQPRIFAVTASVLTSDRTAFLDAGADEFLTKPVRLNTLDTALSRVVGGLPVPPAPAGEEAPATAPLDPETVEELRDLGEDAFAHLYRQYVEGLETTVAALLAADISVDVEDESSLPRLAHRLKGSSAAMGALRLADVCRRLEDAVEPSADRDDVLSALREESRLVRAAVDSLLDAP